jgi:hypothetical protein
MPLLSSLVSPTSSIVSNSASQPVPTTVSDATVALEEIAFYLGKLVKMSESSAVVDTAQRQRVSIDAAPATITTQLVSNQAVILRGEGNSNLYQSGGNAFNIYGAVPEVWRTMDIARQNFQTSIRSNLQFS